MEDIYEIFEYGTREFPDWFDILVKSGSIKISKGDFPELQNNGKAYAGILLGEDFYYGDIFVKKNDGIVEVYSSEEFKRKYPKYKKEVNDEFKR